MSALRSSSASPRPSSASPRAPARAKPPRTTAHQVVREVSADAARRFLVTRHLLAPPRSQEAGLDGVRSVFRQLGSVQFDPLGVAGRNHDLVLHARVRDYDPIWTDELLYGLDGRRELFEAYNKALNLLPTSELPWFRHTWDRHAAMYENGVFIRHAEAVGHIMGRIHAEGPLSTLDFERRPHVDWAWGPTGEIRAVMEALAEAGVLGLARREGNRRYYDLVERLFPAELLAHRPTVREQVKHRLLSRYRGHGLLGVTGQAELFLGIGPAKPDAAQPDRPSRREIHEELVAEEALVAVTVEDVRGPRYVLASELPILDEAVAAATQGGARASSPAVTFLAPLDPFVWDRDFLRSLFGFDYVWEVYVPEAKRRWGYYVLPILFGDRLVGRIEPRIDRAAGTVRILGAWWEAGFDPRSSEGFVDAMRDALRAYLRFGAATRVAWEPALARERRLFGSAPLRGRGGGTHATLALSALAGGCRLAP